jgi:hypothetical protein
MALLHAGFGLAIPIACRAPVARLCAAASDKPRVIRNKKGFTFSNILHFTLPKQANRKCEVL